MQVASNNNQATQVQTTAPVASPPVSQPVSSPKKVKTEKKKKRIEFFFQKEQRNTA